MLIVLSSVTSAQRLKKMLAAKNIASGIVQTPKSISEGGCSYSLRIDEKHLEDALAIASVLHINAKKIYPEKAHGKNS